MKLSGIILSDICRGFEGGLTKNRTCASIPFGGRYRFIDFALSNMTNSSISSICVVTGTKYRSLADHIGGGSAWDLNRKGADLFVLSSFGEKNNRGSFEALADAEDFVDRCGASYVILCDSTVLCNIDYRTVVEEHIKSHCDITVVCNSTLKEYELCSEDLIIKQKGGMVSELFTGFGEEDALRGMGMYVISRKLLGDVLKKGGGKRSFERDWLVSGFNRGSLTVNPYVFEGVVLRNPNTTAYFKNSFLVNDPNVRKSLFREEAPIRTKVRDSGPALFKKGAQIKNTTVADGCIISGTAKNCILFRDVVIEEGACVCDSILMQGTRIEKNASVNYTIADKNVTVSQGSLLSGAPLAPLTLNKGVSV